MDNKGKKKTKEERGKRKEERAKGKEHVHWV